MLSSGGILQAVRVDIFGENQTRFGKRLGLKKGTILRLEGHREGQRPKARHLSLLRLLRAPNDKAELLVALLKQLEVAIEEERRAEEALQREGLGSSSSPSASQDGNESPRPLAARLEQVAQRAEDAFQQAALRTQEIQLLEELAQRTEQAAQRAEQLCREEEARRAEDAREREEGAQRAERAAQRAEQLFREEEARRAAEARKLGETEKFRVAERTRMRRLAFAALAAGAVFSSPIRGAGEAIAVDPPRAGPGDLAQAEHQDAKPPEPSSEDRDVVAEDSGSLLSSGLDGGTELTSLMSQALPFPKTPLPEQLDAPCPEGAEEINGHCWTKFMLTPAQVKGGTCDTAGLYEPADGWCRTHHAGYRPLRATLRKNNSVDPQ